MESIPFVRICRAEAIAFAGLFAGGSMYINAVQIPAVRTVKDTPSMLQCWKESFNIAKILQPSLAILSATAAGVVYYNDDSPQRNLWLAGAVTMIAILPWTKFIMIEDINRLCKDDVMSTRGDSWVRNEIDTWNKRHLVRTLMSMTSFGLFLYASQA